MEKIKITALICTYNEELNLPYVLPKVLEIVDEILLVDGYSTDKTIETARKLRPDVRILYQPGRGKADALIHGVKEATGDIIVTIDADGETDPEDIPKFIEPLLNGYDFAKGSRLANGYTGGKQAFRRFGNKVLVFTYNLLYGTHFTDVCSGYNAFYRKNFLDLELTFNINEVGCSMEQQMLCRAKKAGFKIKEVPHRSVGRIAGVSRINGFRQATRQGLIDWFVIIKERFCG